MISLTFIVSLLLLGAFASFFAGLLGLGGGILIIPGLTSLFAYEGMDHNVFKLALGTSLATVFFTALISMRAHRKFTTVNWKVVRLIVPGLVLGGFIGPVLATKLSATLLMGLFALMLLYLGIKFLCQLQPKKGHAPLNPPLITVSSFAIGIAASMMGLGGGILMIPFLSRFDLEMREIVSISAVCLIPASFISTMGYAYAGWNAENLPEYTTGYIYWLAVAPLVFMSVFFAPMGVRLVHTLPQAMVRRIFGGFLIMISLHMGLKVI